MSPAILWVTDEVQEPDDDVISPPLNYRQHPAMAALFGGCNKMRKLRDSGERLAKIEIEDMEGSGVSWEVLLQFRPIEAKPWGSKCQAYLYASSKRRALGFALKYREGVFPPWI